jgi:hypothetical protein
VEQNFNQNGPGDESEKAGASLANTFPNSRTRQVHFLKPFRLMTRCAKTLRIFAAEDPQLWRSDKSKPYALLKSPGRQELFLAATGYTASASAASRLVGGNVDCISLLQAGLSSLHDDSRSQKAQRTTSDTPRPAGTAACIQSPRGVKRDHLPDDIAWTHNATASDAREVRVCRLIMQLCTLSEFEALSKRMG